VAGVRECAEGLGYVAAGHSDSRLPGPKGNREVFLWLRPGVAGSRGRAR
jgi:hypothetical protein